MFTKRAKILIKNILGILSEISEWILYLSVAFLLIIFATFNFSIFSLAILLVIIFYTPFKWKAWEHFFRITFFYFGSFVWILGLIKNYGLASAPYMAALIIWTLTTTFLIVTKLSLRVPALLGVHNVFISLSVLIAMVIHPMPNQELHIVGSFSIITSVLMTNYLCIAIRRTTIVSCINNPINFQALLEKMIKDQKESKLIAFRFSEFLKFAEEGALDHAYITLSTGLLEAIGVWDMKKNKQPRYKQNLIPYTHDDIRGALVHSTPKKWKISEKGDDLLKKVQEFRKAPFVAICDLLDAVAKYAKARKM